MDAAVNNGLPPTLTPQDYLWSRIVDLLESTHWADNLTGKDVLRLSNYLQVCVAQRGAVVVGEGSHDAYMCLLVEGKASVIKRGHGDATKRVGEIRPGKTFGEMSLVDGEPRSASVIAEEISTLIVLTADDFARLSSDYPKLAMKVVLKISKLLSQRLRQTTGILADHIER